jgi:hypothetical protein
LSQIYKSLASGPVPPAVPTSFTADDATIGIPVANNYHIFSRDTTVNNVNGIQTTVDPNGSQNHYVEFTNRLQGTTTTVGAVTGNLITFTLGATPGTYAVEVRISGFESTTPAGVGYSLFGSIRTTGAAASIIGTVDRINNEEAALAAATATMIASGNDLIVQVTGVAALSINWSGIGLYTFVS